MRWLRLFGPCDPTSRTAPGKRRVQIRAMDQVQDYSWRTRGERTLCLQHWCSVELLIISCCKFILFMYICVEISVYLFHVCDIWSRSWCQYLRLKHKLLRFAFFDSYTIKRSSCRRRGVICLCRPESDAATTKTEASSVNRFNICRFFRGQKFTNHFARLDVSKQRGHTLSSEAVKSYSGRRRKNKQGSIRRGSFEGKPGSPEM